MVLTHILELAVTYVNQTQALANIVTIVVPCVGVCGVIIKACYEWHKHCKEIEKRDQELRKRERELDKREKN